MVEDDERHKLQLLAAVRFRNATTLHAQVDSWKSSEEYVQGNGIQTKFALSELHRFNLKASYVAAS